MSDSIVSTIANYATRVDGELDDAVTHEVARRTLDSLACAFLAMNGDGPKAARRYGYGHPVADGPRLWGTSFRADVQTAALVNGVAVRYLDLNDSYFSLEGCHPSDVIPGIIAVGETLGSSGQEVALSVAIAYDVAMAMSDACSMRAGGWDHVNVTGIGACAGVGRLMGLTEEQQGHAIALHVVPHAAMRQTRQAQLSMWKGFAAADSLRQAIYACSLARAGVTGPAESFEGRHGLINQMLGGELPNRSAIERLGDLPSPRRILETHIKVWPFGYVAQSAVEAAQRVREQLPDDADIESVEITTFQAGVDLMGTDEKWVPKTRETADHSLPYVVSEMLRRGRVDADSFTSVRFADPDAHAFLKDRVRVVVDEDFTNRYPNEFPTRIVVVADGVTYSEELGASLGHASRPMSDAQIREKYDEGASKVLAAEQAEQLADAALGLGGLAAVADLTELTVA